MTALFNPMLGDIRGKLAGNVFSRNRNGAYLRQKVTPVNPNTAAQVVARARLTEFAENWSASLSEAERGAWIDYAEGTPFVNVFGDTYFLTGLQHYIRSNTVLRQTTFVDRDSSPGSPGQAASASPQLQTSLRLLDSASTPANTVRVEADELDGFAEDSDTQALTVALGRLVGQGVNYYTTPVAFIQTIEGDSTTPPTTVDIAVGKVVDPSTKLWVRFRRVNSNGRLSPPSMFPIIAETV